MIDALTWIPVVAPLLGAALVVALASQDPGVRRMVAIMGPALALGAALIALLTFDPNQAGYQFETRVSWLPQYGLSLRLGLDATSLALLLLSCFVGFCALLASNPRDERSAEHQALLLLTLAACNGAFLSINFFFFYFFAELTTLPKYLLIVRWARRGAENGTPNAAQVALQATLYVLLGAMALLAVVALLFANATGPLDFDVARASLANLDPKLALVAYAVAALALGLWSGLWPLHSWAPPVYTAAMAPTNMLFGGVVKCFGLYGLLRLGTSLLPEAATTFGPVLAALGAINILYGAWAAMRQRDWNRVLAFASISHAGYTLIALGVGSQVTLAAAATLMLAHGLVTGLGFVLTDELEWSVGTRDTSSLGGLAKPLPLLSLGFVALAIAGSGIPGTATFAAELMMFFGTWAHGGAAAQAITAIAIFGVVLSATYMFSALHSTFFGETAQGAAEPRKLRPLPLVAAALLVFATVLLGVFPRVVTDALAAKPVPSAAANEPLSDGAPAKSAEMDQ